MALPQQAIDRLVRTSEKTQGAYGDLLLLAGTLFAISIFIWVGLVYGYKPYLETQVTKLNAQIQTFTQQIPVAEQESLIRFYSQLTNLKTILGAHIAPSLFFNWFQGVAQPNVYYSKMTLNVDARQLTLTGVSKTVEDAAEQLALFQNDPNIASVSFNNIGSGGNGFWQFVVNLTLNPSLLSGDAARLTANTQPLSTSTTP